MFMYVLYVSSNLKEGYFYFHFIFIFIFRSYNTSTRTTPAVLRREKDISWELLSLLRC